MSKKYLWQAPYRSLTKGNKLSELGEVLRIHSDLVTLYFLNGLMLAYPASAMFEFLKTELGMSGVAVTHYFSTIFLVFTTKFIWAAACDVTSISPWNFLFVASFVASVLFLVMALAVTSPSGAYVVGLPLTLSEAVFITVADGIAVNRAKGRVGSSTDIQSSVRLASHGAGIFAASLSSIAFKLFELRTMLACTAAFPFGALMVTKLMCHETRCPLFLAEPPTHTTVSNRASALRAEVFQIARQWFVPVVYVVLCGILPKPSDWTSLVSASGATITFPISQFLRPAVSQCAIVLYWLTCKHRDLKHAIVWTTLLSLVLNAVCFAIFIGVTSSTGPNIPSAMIVLKEALTSFDSVLVLMPTLVLGSIIAKGSVAAFGFATFFSFSNFGTWVGGFVCAGLKSFFEVTASNRSSLFKFFCFSCVLRPLTLIFLCFMRINRR